VSRDAERIVDAIASRARAAGAGTREPDVTREADDLLSVPQGL